LGSTRILTDSIGTVQNSYGYQAFGELDYQFGTLENSYLFTGEQYDNNVGFYYLRARFYNPQIGRFQNMDVFPGMQFEPVTLHKYMYGNGSPANFVDPSGYFSLIEQGMAQRIAIILATTAYTDVIIANLSPADGLFAHSYDDETLICRKAEQEDCRVKNVYFALLHFPAPVTEIRNIGNTSSPSLLWGLPGQGNYVTHETDDLNKMITNRTLPTHIFHNGYVERQVIERGGQIFITIKGRGTNLTPFRAFLNELLAPAVFAWPDARIKETISSGLTKQNPFSFQNNLCGLGSIFC